MIIDGKFIEENSIPLDRLMSSVVTTSSYNADAEALNTRISKIENLEMNSGEALQTFNTTTVNHFSTLINDESTATAPTHSIKAGTVTDTMLATALKNKIVYTDQNRTITAADTFTGGLTFTGTSTYTGAAANTNVINVTKGNIAAQTISAAGKSTLSAVSATTVNVNNTGSEALVVEGGAVIKGGLTVRGTTTTVNSTNLSVSDQLIVVNEGGSTPSSSNITGIVVGPTSTSYDQTAGKHARLTYKGDGWYVRNHSATSASQTESKIVTEAYLTAQGYQTTSNLEDQIKNTMKKYIARGSVTLAGTTGVLVDLTVSKYATFAANITNGDSYDVFVTLVTPNTGNGGTAITASATSSGGIQVVKTDAKKFKIFNSGLASSGTTNGAYVHWMAVNRALMTA